MTHRKALVMSWVTIGWILVAIGVLLIYVGVFQYKEGSQQWFAAHADFVVMMPGFVLYVAGLCTLFNQAAQI